MFLTLGHPELSGKFNTDVCLNSAMQPGIYRSDFEVVFADPEGLFYFPQMPIVFDDFIFCQRGVAQCRDLKVQKRLVIQQ